MDNGVTFVTQCQSAHPSFLCTKSQLKLQPRVCCQADLAFPLLTQQHN